MRAGLLELMIAGAIALFVNMKRLTDFRLVHFPRRFTPPDGQLRKKNVKKLFHNTETRPDEQR